MQRLLKTLKKEIFPISLILILALARLIPHPPNFTPIVAVAIMSSYFFRNMYLSFAVIIVSMLLADVFIGFYNNMFFAEYWAKVNNTKVYHFIAEQSDIDILIERKLPTDNICKTAISNCLLKKDFASDGIHLGPKVHNKFAQIIFDWIKT